MELFNSPNTTIRNWLRKLKELGYITTETERFNTDGKLVSKRTIKLTELTKELLQ